MSDFEDQLDNKGALERAARYRVQDIDHYQFSAKEIDIRASRYLSRKNKFFQPGHRTGQVLDSVTTSEFLKDSKFFITYNNGQLSDLQEQIGNISNQGFALLHDMQQQALSLDAFISEEEIKTYGRYSTVHFNSFIREIDNGLAYDDKRWLLDYKTQLVFLLSNLSSSIPSAGLLLPIRDQVYLPIRDAYLVGEETDVGDSSEPLFSSSPRNVFLPDKIFRHVILKQEHNQTSKVFRHTPSYCTVMLELAQVQLINFVEIDPLGHSQIFVDTISFINEGGEEIELDASSIDVGTTSVLLLEPIRTRFLKLKFNQFAPVTKTNYLTGNHKIREFNKILRGAGWTHLLNEITGRIEGRVFDFSLRNVRVGLFVFESLGVFRSKDVVVKKPLGLTFNSRAQAINLTDPVDDYDSTGLQLAEGAVLSEYYIGAHLVDDDNNTVLEDMFPIPDTYPVQQELLPISGKVGKVKLFPDITWAIDKIKIVNSWQAPGNQLVLVLEEEHDFVIDDQVSFLSSSQHPLLGTYRVQAISDTSITIQDSGMSPAWSVTQNMTPYVFVYKANTLSTVNQDPPFDVYQQNTLLVLGTDYQISFDGGGIWFGSWPSGLDLVRILTKPEAGSFRVKINNHISDQLYWIRYRVLANQSLSPTGLISLHSGQVVFNGSAQEAHGKLNTVIISRAQMANPYITSIILSYALKVRENVS